MLAVVSFAPISQKPKTKTICKPSFRCAKSQVFLRQSGPSINPIKTSRMLAGYSCNFHLI